jgi:hypothetical protein
MLEKEQKGAAQNEAEDGDREEMKEGLEIEDRDRERGDRQGHRGEGKTARQKQGESESESVSKQAIEGNHKREK